MVDIGKIGLGVEKASIEDLKNVGKELSAAFKEIGFVFVSNHGIDESITITARESSKEYFKVFLNKSMFCLTSFVLSSIRKSKEKGSRKAPGQMYTRVG